LSGVEKIRKNNDNMIVNISSHVNINDFLKTIIEQVI
jgi:hypothetical protein